LAHAEPETPRGLGVEGEAGTGGRVALLFVREDPAAALLEEALQGHAAGDRLARGPDAGLQRQDLLGTPQVRAEPHAGPALAVPLAHAQRDEGRRRRRPAAGPTRARDA